VYVVSVSVNAFIVAKTILNCKYNNL
jgi:hypothetical protein